MEIINFLKENSHISIREIERELGLAQASIRLAEGILPKKHLEEIRKYLVEHYGFEKLVDSDGNLESKSQVIRKYNVGRIPGFTDGIPRFQDEVGFWKRVTNFGMMEEKGIKILKDGFKPQGKERFTDKIGEFYIANNGLKIYEKFKLKK